MRRRDWRTTSRRSARAIPVGSRAGQRTRSLAGRSAAPGCGDCSGADLTPQVLHDALQILDEGAHLELAGLVVGRAQDRRGMDGRHDWGQTGSLDELAAMQAHPEVAAAERLGSSGAKQHEQVRLDGGDLGVQPGPAGVDLGSVRLLVQATLPLRFALEVLDGVRDVDASTIDARFLERLIEDAPGRTDEGLAFDILAIARLLAHEHDLGMLRPLAKDGLGAGLVEVTRATAGGRLAQRH